MQTTGEAIFFKYQS